MPRHVCAIIGFGKMGRVRYETLKQMPDCHVKWVFEPLGAAEFPVDVQVARNLEEIYNDPETCVVFVCTANQLLKDTVVQSLGSGKHVFCEKPPGRNLAELQTMVEVERRSSAQKLMFGFNHRHHESVLHAKRLIDSGEYGPILWMRGRYGKSVDENFFSSWRSKKDMAGGGIFLDQGIHMLDLFLMLVGDFDEVKAMVSNLYWKLDIEDNVFAIFRNTRTGQVASLHSTMTQWRHLFSLEIFLERGYITINGLKTSSNTYGDEAMTIAKNRTAPPAASWTCEEELTFHVDSSWKREMDAFFDCIVRNMPVSSGSSADALKLMHLVEEVYAQK